MRTTTILGAVLLLFLAGCDSSPAPAASVNYVLDNADFYSYDRAEAACVTHGGHLAEVHTQDDLSRIMDACASSGSTQACWTNITTLRQGDPAVYVASPFQPTFGAVPIDIQFPAPSGNGGGYYAVCEIPK